MFDIIDIADGDFRLMLILTIAFALAILISFSLHEFAHAFVSYKCGDPTAKVAGRLTMNPVAHFDTMGFLCLFLFGFGWAKPVPINPLNYRNFKKGLVLTSIAGVVANLILAFISCGFFNLFINIIAVNVAMNEYVFAFVLYFFSFLVSINLGLLVFNLLPVPPLDGFNVISAISKYENKFINFMQKYGTLILLLVLLLFEGLLGFLISLISIPINSFWMWIFGLF